MPKTNNFDKLPKTEELWIKVDDWILKVYYKDDKWWESIKKEDTQMDFFIEKEEDMENIYLSHCISAYEIYSKKEQDNELDFAGRTISFSQNKDFKNTVSIQTGKEDGKGFYDIDLIFIERKKWLEIAEFFNHISCLFLNAPNLIKKLREDDGEE